jgi:hypothetical protein
MDNIIKLRRRIANSKSDELRISMDEAVALLGEIDQLLEARPIEAPEPAAPVQPLVSDYVLDGGGFS